MKWHFLLLLMASMAIADPLKLIRKIPHSGYSEGLDYYEGYLWHALPKQILKINPADGSVLERFTPPTDHSESVVWVPGERLLNLSFSNNGIYEGKLLRGKIEFKKVGQTPEVHSWGSTWTGKQLVITGDYSNKLYFLNPKTFKVEKTIVTEVGDLEDLAWDGKGVWSSSFTQHRGQIFRIDPKTGKKGKFYSLPDPEECPVVDGLAFDGKHLWVTGKDCPSIYYLERPQ